MINQFISQIKKGRVQPFRDRFDSLTFDEVGRIYAEVTPHFGVQRHFHLGQFKQAAEAIGLSGVVVELGDHDGELARMALESFPGISAWVGYDVCDAETRLEHPKYKHEELADWFHESVALRWVDVFVSTHTLEHMGVAALETLEFVSRSSVKKMIIEMPFRNTGNWNGSKSLHVFNGKPVDIINALKGWEIVYHGKSGMNHTWGAVR